MIDFLQDVEATGRSMDADKMQELSDDLHEGIREINNQFVLYRNRDGFNDADFKPAPHDSCKHYIFLSSFFWVLYVC